MKIKVCCILLLSLGSSGVGAGVDISDAPTFVTEVITPNVMLIPLYKWNANEAALMDLPWDKYFYCQKQPTPADCAPVGDKEPPFTLTTQVWTSGAPFSPQHLWRVTPWPGADDITLDYGGGHSESAVYSTYELYPGDIVGSVPDDFRHISLNYNSPSYGGQPNMQYEYAYPEAGVEYYYNNNTRGLLAYLRSDKNFLYYNPAINYEPWPSLGGREFTTYEGASAATPYYNPLRTSQRTSQGDVEIKADLSRTEKSWLYQEMSTPGGVREFDHLIGQYNVWSPVGGNNDVWRSTNYQTHRWPSLTSEQQENFANWFSYWRSSYLASRGVMAKLVSSLKKRDILDRFRISIPYYVPRVGVPLAIYTPNGDTRAARISSMETGLADFIYDYGKRFDFNHPERALGYFSTLDAYRDDPTRGDGDLSRPNPARSCRRNYEIILSPDYTSLAHDYLPKITDYGDVDGDGRKKLWADYGAKVYKDDLMPALSNDLLPGKRDTATWQHIVMYIVAPKAYGRLFNRDYTSMEDADRRLSDISRDDWFNLTTDRIGSIDDLWHMALNSKGYYYHSSDVQQAVNNLLDAFNDILVNNTTGAAVATNTTSLSTGGSIYQATVENNWNGHLLAYPVTVSSRDINGVAQTVLSLNYDTATWDLATTLSATTPGNDRTIVSYNRDTGTGADFSWDTIGKTLQDELQSNLRNLLGLGNEVPDADKPGVAKNILAYLRGAGTCEEDSGSICTLSDGSRYSFRRRNLVRGKTGNYNPATNSGGRNILGDIANSNPWVVAPPLIGISDVDYPGYNAHRKAKSKRLSVLYVGANDGMLHAVNANNGAELFSYIPSFVQPNLAQLAGVGYSHRYYVDGSPFSAEVDISGTGSGWKTVLAGGANKGGKGYYLLDITDPTEVTADSLVKWEFTNTDDADLNYSYLIPSLLPQGDARAGQARQIARIKTSNKTSAWALFAGNGYSDTSGARACLFVLGLAGKGRDGVWTEGTDYWKICVGQTDYSTDSGLDTNGLSTPYPVDLNGDGNVDRVYAGDVNGNMWAFDLHDPDPSNWKAALQQGGDCSNSGPEHCVPLYVAKNADGIRQSIIPAPEVTPFTFGGKNGVIVLFGTGKFLGSTDRVDNSKQTFYAIWDRGAYDDSVNTFSDLTRANLFQQSYAFSTDTLGTDDVRDDIEVRRQGSPTGFTYCNSGNLDGCAKDSYLGWYWDMPGVGERLTGRISLITGTVLFNTFIPQVDALGKLDPCAYGGTGWLMGMNADYGHMQNFAVFDLNRNGVIDADEPLAGGVKLGAAIGGTTFTEGIGSTRYGVYAPTNLGKASSEGDKMNIIISTDPNSTGRVSWFELVD